jgi:Arc/MetJ-type ribon-helix-helix transcriptional regulator
MKQRLSVSVDADLLAAAGQATKRGEAKNLSAWVNDALRLKLDHETRLRAGAAFIAEYEAEHGPITAADRAAAVREAKRRAISVRGLRAGEARRRYGR